jgi:hypothetical protein
LRRLAVDQRRSMQTRTERGEGQRSSVIWLVVIAAAIYAGWNIVPIYVSNYTLADKVNQLARTPRGSIKDDALADLIMKEVRENYLDAYIEKSCFHIQTLETSRRITCEYERTEKVLPGINHTFHFTLAADQPLIY